MRSPARATFKNPNFQSLCELGKTWMCNLSPRFTSPNFESIDKKHDAENKMGKLRLATFQI